MNVYHRCHFQELQYQSLLVTSQNFFIQNLLPWPCCPREDPLLKIWIWQRTTLKKPAALCKSHPSNKTEPIIWVDKTVTKNLLSDFSTSGSAYLQCFALLVMEKYSCTIVWGNLKKKVSKDHYILHFYSCFVFEKSSCQSISHLSSFK